MADMAVILETEWESKYRQEARKKNMEQLKSYAEEEVKRVLQPYAKVRKRDMVVDFCKNAVVSVVLPVVGPLALIILEGRSFIRKLCTVVGLEGPKCSAVPAIRATLVENIPVWVVRELVPVVGSVIGVVVYIKLHRKIVRDLSVEATKLHVRWITENTESLFPA